MDRGARTPEELEGLFEDAGVVGDPVAAAALFAPGAVLAVDDTTATGHGLGGLIAELWTRGYRHVAEPGRVLQAGGTALIVAKASISVARREAGAGWRYAITHIDPKEQ